LSLNNSVNHNDLSFNSTMTSNIASEKELAKQFICSICNGMSLDNLLTY